MKLETTKVFEDTIIAFNDPEIRVIISYGGTSSSKSISIYQLLVLYALKQPNKNIAIIAENIPVIKRNVIKDLKSVVMKDIWDVNSFNKQDMTYTFSNGSFFQFLSASNPDSFSGYRSDVSYFDEINNIPKGTYDQITMRCKEKILCTFNPTSEFWITEEMGRADAEVIKSTYLDNKSSVTNKSFLAEGIIKELLVKAKASVRFQQVYIDGDFGVADGIVFEEGKNWSITKEFPDNYKWRTFGLDFGYTNDPSVLVEVRFANGELFIKQHFYKTGLLANDFIKYIKDNKLQNEIIIADNSDQRLIEEIRRSGVPYIKKVIKGAGSIMSGINNLLDYKMNVYYESVDAIKEFRNYSYIKDKKTGGYLNKPVDLFNHFIDGLRYSVSEKLTRHSESRMTVYNF